MELYKTKEIKKTRKDHWCYGCSLFIPKGASCHYETGIFDGVFFAHHLCIPCRKTIENADEDDSYFLQQDGYGCGDLRNEMERWKGHWDECDPKDRPVRKEELPDVRGRVCSPQEGDREAEEGYCKYVPEP